MESTQIRVGRNLWISLEVMKTTSNPCGARYVSFVENHEEHSESVWGHLRIDFPEKEHTKHRESVWGHLWTDFLKSHIQSTENACGALSVNFLDNHGEHGESV